MYGKTVDSEAPMIVKVVVIFPAPRKFPSEVMSLGLPPLCTQYQLLVML